MSRRSTFWESAWVAILMSAAELANLATGRALNQYGIIPRHTESLPGIAMAPFLHADWSHYLSNLVPVLVLSYVLMEQGRRRFWQVTLSIILGTGLLVWMLGRPAMHIGASGLVYGWFGYLLLWGLLSRHIKDLLISLVLMLVYSGWLWGLLSFQAHISWESHLAGFLTGALVAWTTRRRRR
jgi:membrane associated rhomboid family serine protease